MKKLFLSFIFICSSLSCMEPFRRNSVLQWKQIKIKKYYKFDDFPISPLKEIACDDGICTISNDTCSQWQTAKNCLASCKRRNKIDFRTTGLSTAQLVALLQFKANPQSVSQEQLEQLFHTANYLEAIPEMGTIVEQYVTTAQIVTEPENDLQQIKKSIEDREYTKQLQDEVIEKLLFLLQPLGLPKKITHAIAYQYLQKLDRDLANCNNQTTSTHLKNKITQAVELIRPCPRKGYKNKSLKKFYDQHSVHLSMNQFETLDGLGKIITNQEKLQCINLYLEHNNLDELNLAEIFKIFPNLKFLSLKNNNIKTLKSNSLSHLPRNFHLLLNGNPIQLVEKKAFHSNVNCTISIADDLPDKVKSELSAQIDSGIKIRLARAAYALNAGFNLGIVTCFPFGYLALCLSKDIRNMAAIIKTGGCSMAIITLLTHYDSPDVPQNKLIVS